MNGKPVVLREQARHDVDEMVDDCLSETGAANTLAFIDALEASLRQIGEHPGAGSSRHAHELDLPDLRFRTVREFPCLVFHVEMEAEIDVWRVLHGVHDVAAWMREPHED